MSQLRTLSADGRVMVAAIREANSKPAETIQIWDRQSGKLRLRWQLPDDTELYYECIAISRTGRLLATRSTDRPIRIWDLSGKEPRQVHEISGACMNLAFSPDERLLAAACQFGRVRLWNLDNGQALPDLQRSVSGSDWAHCVCFSQDGKRVAAGNNSGVVQVWELPTARLLAKLKGHLGEIKDLVFFPDGRRLAVASVESIRLWEVEVGQELMDLNTPESKAIFLTVTSDGANLISRHDDGVVRIWKSRPRDSLRVNGG